MRVMRVSRRKHVFGSRVPAVGSARVLALGLVLSAALACLCAGALAGGRAAPSVPVVGVADDAPKYAGDGGRAIYAKLRQLGLREVRLVIDFDPDRPTTIQEKPFLDRSVSRAVAAGIDVVFSVYPSAPRAFATDTDTRVAAYAAYLGLLARTYPQVRKFIVLNEPNEGYFFAPQFRGRSNVSSRIAFEALAAGYDRLKAVDSGITVIGLGLSPDGNGITSTPPVRFIKLLGDAYRASGRTKPIMDVLGFHVHPRDSATFDGRTHFRWPNAGPADLDRIKQAIWDAFRGTGQPIFPETAGVRAASRSTQPSTLRFMLAEVAVQVRVLDALASQYTYAENVPVADEAWQAKAYPSLLRAFACDPSVADVLLFLLIDQQDLRRFQSGLLRIDGSARPSFASVRDAVANLGCGLRPTWRHTSRVIGARGTFASQATYPALQSVFGLTVTAAEDATAKAGLLRVGGPNAPTGAKGLAAALDRLPGSAGPRLTDTAVVKARFSPRLEVHGRVRPGFYRFVVRLRALVNPSRTSVFVGPLMKIGAAS
jgi:hypothetical protein